MKNLIRIFVSAAIFMLLFVFMTALASAATVTWQGDESALWSVGGNWSSGFVPGASDVATFDGTGNTPCTIDVVADVAGIDINSGYTNTITQSAELTIGSSGFAIDAGIFEGGVDDIVVNGNITIAGGTFESTSGFLEFSGDWTHTAGGVWDASMGTVKFVGYRRTFNFDYPTIGSSGVFNNFIYDSTSDGGSYVTLSSGDSIYVQGDLTLYDGRVWYGDYIYVEGDVTVGPWDCYDNSDVAIVFAGDGTQVFDLSGNTDVLKMNITIGTDLASPTVNLASDLLMNASQQSLSVVAGTLNISTYEVQTNKNLSISGGVLNAVSGTLDIGEDVTISDGELIAPIGTMYFGGRWNHVDGGVFTNSGGTVVWDSGDAEGFSLDTAEPRTVPTSGVFHNFTSDAAGPEVNGGAYIGLGSGTLYVEGDLMMTDGRFFGASSSVEVQGDVIVGAHWHSYDVDDSDIVFVGSSEQTFDLTGATNLLKSPVVIGSDEVSANVILASDLILSSNSQDLVIVEGVLNLNGYDVTANLSGQNFYVQDGGTFAWQGTETLTLNTSAPELAAGSTVRLNPIAGTFDLPAWDYHHLAVYVPGGGATVQLTATESLPGDFTLMGGVFDVNDQDFVINGDLNISDGTFKTGTGSVTFGDTGDDSVVISDGYFDIESDATDTDLIVNAGTWINSGGTIRYAAETVEDTNFLGALGPYNNVEINSLGSTYSLDVMNTTVNGDVVITAGTLDAGSNYNLKVQGNWTNNDTFMPNGGTVYFEGAGETLLTGDTSFNNLICITAGKTLTFTSGSTQTVNTIQLNGAEGNLITLQGSTTSTWNIEVNGGVNLDYLNVSYSSATGSSAPLEPGENSFDGGNNTGWSFNEAPTAVIVSVGQDTDGSGNVTITFAFDDPDGDDTGRVKVYYKIADEWVSATLEEEGETPVAEATYGSPRINNESDWQVGGESGYIETSSGENEITVVWEAATDLSADTEMDGVKIKVRPNDSTDTGEDVVSDGFTVDLVAPAGLGDFVNTSKADKSAGFSWTAASDTNFDHYELWYASYESEVENRTGYAVEFDDVDYPELGEAETTNLTITINQPYGRYFAVYAVDEFGNSATVSAVQVVEDVVDGVGFFGGANQNDSRDNTSSEEEVEGEEEVEDEEVEEEEVEVVTVIRPDGSLEMEVPEHWSENYLKNLGEDAYVIEEAFVNDKFLDILEKVFDNPDGLMTRADALQVALVLGGFDYQGTEYAGTFGDVSEDHKQMQFIEYAYASGIIVGYRDGTFRPDEVVNRVEALKIATKVYGWPVTNRYFGEELLGFYFMESSPFADIDMQMWYAPYLAPAVAYTVVQGYGEQFLPHKNVTYAEFVKMATLLRSAYDAVELASEME